MKSTAVPARKSSLKRRLPFIVLILALLAVGGVVYAYTRPNTTVITPQVGQAPVSPDPGQPGNPGDAAKSDIYNESQKQSEDTSSPTPTPSPASGSAGTVSNIKVTDLVLTPQSDGRVYVNSMVTGASSGTCNLALTSPGQTSTTATGAVEFDGRNYFCSFQRIDGISEAGSWTASLTVTQSGSTSSAATANFKK